MLHKVLFAQNFATTLGVQLLPRVALLPSNGAKINGRGAHQRLCLTKDNQCYGNPCRKKAVTMRESGFCVGLRKKV